MYRTAALRQSGPDLCRELMKIKTPAHNPPRRTSKSHGILTFFEFEHKSSKIEILSGGLIVLSISSPACLSSDRWRYCASAIFELRQNEQRMNDESS